MSPSPEGRPFANTRFVNGIGTPATEASSVKISESIGERSWPPYSLGQFRVSHPSLPICATVSR